MFNRAEYGLHHPGNLVPVCKSCNKRARNAENRYVSWQEHFERVCTGQPAAVVAMRRARIVEHSEKYRYPELSLQEKHAIRVIAEALYDNIKAESEKALSMYRKLDQAFVVKSHE